jgi:hypothetical protein
VKFAASQPCRPGELAAASPGSPCDFAALKVWHNNNKKCSGNNFEDWNPPSQLQDTATGFTSPS